MTLAKATATDFWEIMTMFFFFSGVSASTFFDFSDQPARCLARPYILVVVDDILQNAYFIFIVVDQSWIPP